MLVYLYGQRFPFFLNSKGLRIMRSRILRVRRKILWIQFLVEHVVGNVVNCVIPYFNGVWGIYTGTYSLLYKPYEKA